MPDSGNPLFTVARAAAKQSAQALRLGAAVLDHLSGGDDQQPEPPEQPREAPERAERPAGPRRGPAAGRPAPKPRPSRQASTRPKDLDDGTIARKVESAIAREGKVPKGAVDVNVADGVAFLRGQVKHPDDVNRLEQIAGAVPEVKGVENLLHLPKTPSPTRTDTPEHQRTPAGRRSKPHTPEIHLEPSDVNAEIPVPGAEPSPAQLARQRKGRPASPLGSHAPAGAGGAGGSAGAPKVTPPSQPARPGGTPEKDPEPAKPA